MFQGKGLVRRFAYSFAIIFAAFVAFAQYSLHAQVFGPPVNVSGQTGNASAPRIAVDSHGNVDIVWLDDSVGTPAVFFSRSSDGGQTFSAPLNISNHQGSAAESEHLAVDSDGHIYVVWSEESEGAHAVLFACSIDNGATFSVPQKVSEDSMGIDPAIAIDSAGGINLVWEDKSAGNASLFYTRSLDQGATFSTPLTLSLTPTRTLPGTPQLTTDSDGNAYIVWTQPNTKESNTIIFSRDATISLKSLTLNPPAIIGNNSSTGTVLLSGPAPAGGATVSLSSGDQAVAAVPSAVTIPEGLTNARFGVNSDWVPTMTEDNISASWGGTSRSATLNVVPAPDTTEQHSVTSVTETSGILQPSAYVGSNESTTQDNPVEQTASPAAVSANNSNLGTDMTVSGNLLAVAGQNALSIYRLNRTIYVDCIKFPCSPDIGVGINAAIADLPKTVIPGTGSSGPTGTVVLPPGTYTQATEVTITSPLVSVEGSGSGSTILNCTVNGDCWNLRAKPFTIAPAGRLYGFSIVGRGVANLNAVGLHTGDIVGAHFEDLQIDNFTGPNGACFWADNESGWFERNYIENVELGIHGQMQSGCTKLLRFTAGSSADNLSFGYNHWSGLRMSIETGEIGFSVEGPSLLYSNFIEGSANVDHGSTTFSFPSGLYNGEGNYLSWPEECDDCGDGRTAVGWYIAPGGQFKYSGPGLLGNGNVESTLSPGPGPAFAVSLKPSIVSQGITGTDFSGERMFYSPVEPGINELMSLDSSNGGSGIGAVVGNGVDHPIAWGSDSDPNCFEVYKKSFEKPLLPSSRVFGIACSGALLYVNGKTFAAPNTSGTLVASDSSFAANNPTVCTDSNGLLTTNNCASQVSSGVLTGGSCTTAAHAFASCTSTVIFSHVEPDANYAASCTGVGPNGWPYVMGIVSKGTSSVTVQIGNGSGPAALPSFFNEIDCTITR